MSVSKPRRLPQCEPDSIKDTKDLGKRLRQSRERLAGSELARIGQAWRLWAACVEQTAGWAREADQIHLGTLAREAAGVHRNAASKLMRRFDELGVFRWEAAPRGSHGISLLTLPSLDAPSRVHGGDHAALKGHEEGPSSTPQSALQSVELCDESLSDAVSLDDGTHRSSLSSEGLGGLEGNEAHQPWDAEDLYRALDAALGGLDS